MQLHYVDTNGMILSKRTEKNIKILKNLEDKLDCSNLVENHEIFIIETKKITGKFKLETPKNIWIKELVCLRSKIDAFECGHESKNKMKRINKSYSKNIRFDEHKECLKGEEYEEECDNYILRSLNYEMYLQKERKFSLSIFDDKRCYINETENIPWN